MNGRPYHQLHSHFKAILGTVRDSGLHNCNIPQNENSAMGRHSTRDEDAQHARRSMSTDSRPEQEHAARSTHRRSRSRDNKNDMLRDKRPRTEESSLARRKNHRRSRSRSRDRRAPNQKPSRSLSRERHSKRMTDAARDGELQHRKTERPSYRARSRSRSRSRERRSPRDRKRSHRVRSRSKSPSYRSRNRRSRTRSESPHHRSSKRRSKSRSPRRHKSRKYSRSPARSPLQRSRKPLPSQLDVYAGDAPGKDPNIPEKQKPNFAPSGLLAAATNTVQRGGESIVLKYNEPPNARLPPASQPWKLFIFKGSDTLATINLHARSAWLMGRETAVCDISMEHPSISGQHAVLQFQYKPPRNEEIGGFGERVRDKGKVKLYVIDLESANGTKLNDQPVEGSRFVEVRSGDVLSFGNSEREYVVMLPPAE